MRRPRVAVPRPASGPGCSGRRRITGNGPPRLAACGEAKRLDRIEAASVGNASGGDHRLLLEVSHPWRIDGARQHAEDACLVHVRLRARATVRGTAWPSLAPQAVLLELRKARLLEDAAQDHLLETFRARPHRISCFRKLGGVVGECVIQCAGLQRAANQFPVEDTFSLSTARLCRAATSATVWSRAAPNSLVDTSFAFAVAMSCQPSWCVAPEKRQTRPSGASAGVKKELSRPPCATLPLLLGTSAGRWVRRALESRQICAPSCVPDGRSSG